MKNQTLWFTGLPCSGKTTLATEVFDILKKDNNIIYIDSEDIRNIYNPGFSEKGRLDNNKTLAIIARFLNQQGYNTIVSSVSATTECRKMIKDIVNSIEDNIIFVYCHASEEDRISRDKKGSYNKDMIEYQPSTDIDISIDTTLHSIESCVINITLALKTKMEQIKCHI